MLESGLLSLVQPYPGSLGLLVTRTSSPVWSVLVSGQQTVAFLGDKYQEISPSVLQNGHFLEAEGFKVLQTAQLTH